MIINFLLKIILLIYIYIYIYIYILLLIYIYIYIYYCFTFERFFMYIKIINEKILELNFR